MTSRKYPPLNF